MSWQAMETLAPYTEDEPSFLVWNGKRIGEAERKEDWSYDFYDDNCEPKIRWAWTHWSTCSCCHSYMEPQPIAWQPMPEPPA